MTLRALLLSALLASPALAQPAFDPLPVDDGVAGVTPAAPALSAAEARVPAQLSPAERVGYRLVFLDIDAGNFASARARLDGMPRGVLHPTAEAQIMLGRGPAAASRQAIADWLSANAALPQAPTLLQLARRLGAATDLPSLPPRKTLRPVSYVAPLSPRASRPELPQDAAFVASARAAIDADDPATVLALIENDTGLSEPVATEWAQRAAWEYYINDDDGGAMRAGERASRGNGEWAALGGWVAGLAAFRANDCARAAASFDRTASGFASDELTAAAAYWASRAHIACGNPGLATERLRQAARSATGFYGLLARRALGLGTGLDWTEPDFIRADWNHLADLPGARRAAALVEIGQLGLADRELRHLATTSRDADYEPILRLAARLNLPATQFWLASNPPAGRRAPLSARFPAPDWQPFRGWRVERALVYAHALQESAFATNATSRAGARGLMQLMPGTARQMAQAAAVTHDDGLLADPSFNIEYGQSYLEALRDMPWTQALLPKVVAAYNAGPGSVQKWNASVRDNGDPLLFIESIPFRETRHYVEVVLRNYWLYAARDGKATPSLDAIAANLWPRFPGLPGPTAVTEPYTPPAPRTPQPGAPQPTGTETAQATLSLR